MDDYDYYQRHRDEYNADEAPYEPLAPDLAGESPLAEWKATAARPSGGQQSDEGGMRLREANAIGASTTPTKEQATGQELYTTPTYWGAENVKEAKAIMGEQPVQMAAAAAPETYAAKTIRAVQQIASGVYERAADVFSRRGER